MQAAIYGMAHETYHTSIAEELVWALELASVWALERAKMEISWKP